MGVVVAARIGIISGWADYQLIRSVIAGEGDVVRLGPADAAAALHAGDFALIVLAPDGDWWRQQPSMAALYAEAARHSLAVLALVPCGDPAALAHAFESGVADCAYYPIDCDEVRTRVRALLRRKLTVDRLRTEAADARRLAHTDPVTGLWNRHYLNTELAAAIVRAQTLLLPLALLMIDIDAFKPVNDRHGHAAGDRVLKAIGARLSGSIRGIDTLARFGGDELVVVMPDIGIGAACQVAERLRGLIADTPIILTLPITVSIGVAELAENDDPATLLARADVALYAAKLAGRNRVAEAA